MHETRIVRERQATARAAADRLSIFPEEGSAAILVQTTVVGAYPVSPGVFFACSPVWVDGRESEGVAATFTADNARTLFACNLGTQIPPIGTRVIAHACGGRWTFRFDG